MNKQKVHIYPDPPHVAAAFAEFMKTMINGSKGQVHIALSGGSTPKLLFQELARAYLHQIDWPKVHFFWSDERCVPPSHEDSNYKMTKEYLLDHLSIPQANIHRIHGEENPEHEALRYTQHIRDSIPNYMEIPRFELIMLGMGEDGHTASIFPDQMELFHAPRSCAVAHHPKTGQKRITLTGKVINNAANVVFLVTGENKRDKYQAIRHHTEEADGLPANFIQPIGNLHWFIDQEVAGPKHQD